MTRTVPLGRLAALKRTGPLKRTTALQRHPLLGPGSSKAPASAPVTSTLRRRGRRKRTQFEIDASAAWIAHVLAPGVCVACGSTAGPLEGAHVIKRQTLERLEDDLGVRRGVLAWDPDLGIALCGRYSEHRCHPRHDLAVQRIARHRLPERVTRRMLELGAVGHRALQNFPDSP